MTQMLITVIEDVETVAISSRILKYEDTTQDEMGWILLVAEGLKAVENEALKDNAQEQHDEQK